VLACLPSRFSYLVLHPQRAIIDTSFPFASSLIWPIEPNYGSHGRTRHSIAVITGTQAAGSHAHQDQGHHAAMRRQHSGMLSARISYPSSVHMGHRTKYLNLLVVSLHNRTKDRPTASEQRRHTQARSIIRRRCSRPSMGRESQAGWPGRFQECCARNLCFRCADDARRVARHDAQFDSIGTRRTKREDLEASRHLGTRSDLPT
jgi:hypothetical protein